MPKLKVKLTYFKASGKYYSDGEYESSYKKLDEIWLEVSDKRRTGRLPGLVNGATEFIVLIDVPDHEHNHPRLLVLESSGGVNFGDGAKGNLTITGSIGGDFCAGDKVTRR